MRVLLVLLTVLLAGSIAFADIISLKNGDVLECEIQGQTVKNGKQVYEVKLEDGKIQHVPFENIAWLAKAKPSWIARKEALEWYGKEIAKLEKKGKKIKASKHESIAKQCRRKKLDEEADKHFTLAYEMKVAAAKDTTKAHEKIAMWLERTAGMFDLAAKEWKWVLDKMMSEYAAKGKETAKDYVKLGQYAEKRALYDEAEALFKKALAIEPDNKYAKAGVTRIRALRDVRVNTALFRTIKAQFMRAVSSYKGKQAGDGSYGGDVPEGGVQGHRAMTALCTYARIGQWEFEGIEKPEASKKIPNDIDKAINFLLAAPENAKKLRGPDVWGNCWTLFLFAKILDKVAMKSYHAKIKTKLEKIFAALAQQESPAGGWMYYDFLKKQPASFVTGVAVLAMVRLKKLKAKVPEDMFAKACDLMKKLKQEDGVWMYRLGQRQSVQGSQGRAGLCETVLMTIGAGSIPAIQLTVENFFKYHNILEAVKGKKGTHIGSGGTAPYYYLYGHLWIARAIQKLPKSSRDTYAAKFRDLFLKDQEANGSFTDFPRVAKWHEMYGAAMGAIALYFTGTLEKQDKPKRR